MTLISVLLPTRGRPEHLRRALDSLTYRSTGFEVLVGCDAGDPATAEYARMPHAGNVRWIIHEPFDTLAAKVNHLAMLAEGHAMMQFANDMTIADGWLPKVARALTANLQPTIFYGFIGQDEGKASLPILRRDMVHELGWFCPPWFVYWFSDSWMTEIVRMSGRGCGIDLGIQHQAGVSGTQGLRDLAFWHQFFELTRPERVAYAAKLRGSPVPEALVEECEELSSVNPNPATYEWYESRAEGVPQPGYMRAKAAAEAYLVKLRSR